MSRFLEFLRTFLRDWLIGKEHEQRRFTSYANTKLPDDLATLAAAVAPAMWAAREPGECCTCGHDWIPGEIIGTVTQAFERTPDGGVLRSPGMRLACCVCVEQQRVQGDLSVRWANEAGVL